MNIEYTLVQEQGGRLWLKRSNGRARRVCTVQETARLLVRTRRQIYRYIKEGVLTGSGKFLGEWLLDYNSVSQLAERPLSRQPIPARFKVLFQEYSLSTLNAGKDRVLVIARLLETGGLDAIRWLIKRYKRKEIRAFLIQEGERLLSPRSLRWWGLIFNASPKPLPAWRAADPWERVQA